MTVNRRPIWMYQEFKTSLAHIVKLSHKIKQVKKVRIALVVTHCYQYNQQYSAYACVCVCGCVCLCIYVLVCMCVCEYMSVCMYVLLPRLHTCYTGSEALSLSSSRDELLRCPSLHYPIIKAFPGFFSAVHFRTTVFQVDAFLKE